MDYLLPTTRMVRWHPKEITTTVLKLVYGETSMRMASLHLKGATFQAKKRGFGGFGAKMAKKMSLSYIQMVKKSSNGSINSDWLTVR